jgi:hypothetical protein
MPGKAFAAFVLPLLPVLILGLPGRAVARPPEGVSGKMVLDEVADGLRKYQAEKDMDKCIPLLERLAQTRGLRVAVAMGEFCEKEKCAGLPPGVNSCLYIAAQGLLSRYYVPTNQSAIEWWRENEANLRRRARQLPQ